MIHFQNDQWLVDQDGMSSRKPSAPYEYHIAKDRLLDVLPVGEAPLYGWPLHMARKLWTDIEAFAEAFEKALEAHRADFDGDVCADRLRASLNRAREIKGRQA